LSTEADPAILTFVFRTELGGTGVGDALEGAAVLVVRALEIVGAARQADRVGARAARTGDALLGPGAGRVETGQQTLAIDAKARLPALEVELTTKGRRVGMVLQGVEAKSAVGAGGSKWTFVRVFALPDAAKRRAYLSNPTIGIRQARVARRCGLRIALVPTA
jgi:hypothetical protein